MKLTKELAYLHFAVLLLGGTGLFGKFLDLNPVTIISGRSVFTCLAVMGVIIYLRQSLHFHNLRNLSLLLISGVVLCFHWYAFFHSIQLSTVAVGVIGFSTYPVFVTFLEPLIFKESFRLADVASGILVFIGLLVVAPELDFSNEITEALAWAVLSGLILAIFTLINRQLVKRNHYLVITFYQHSVAMIVTLPLAYLYFSFPTKNEIFLLMLLGVVFTAIPQSLLVKGLNVVKAQLASVLVGLEPIYSILFAIVLLNEIPELSTILGGAIVAGSVVLATVSHQKQRP